MKRFSLRAFADDTRGNVLILAGLGILFLVGIGGAGYDLGHQQLVKQKMQQATDAAALAAAGMDYGTSDATRQNTALAFFNLNYPANYLGIARPTPSVSIANEQITVSAAGTVPTSFVGNFGVSTIAAAGSSRTQFKRLPTSMDVILVMDNSGSMATTDVGAGNSLNGGATAHASCLTGWGALGYPVAALPSPPYPSYCRNRATCCSTFEGISGLTRINALRYSATGLVDNLMNPNPLNNQVALVTWDLYPINTQNFTTNVTTLKTFLNNMYGRSATDSSMGMQQAQTLASGFRSGTAHAVILMTDGANFLGVRYDAYGNRDYAAEAADQVTVNNNTLAICTALKSTGTIVYTIGFGAELSNASTSSGVARQFLSDCATGPNGATQPNQGQFYYVAPDATSLAAAFASIQGSLKKVQILQ